MTATRRRRSGGQIRVEAPLKLTGAARYAADHRPDGVLHAVLVGAPVAAGRLRGVDAAAALRPARASPPCSPPPTCPTSPSCRRRPRPCDAAVHRRPDPVRGLAGRDRAGRVDRGGRGGPRRRARRLRAETPVLLGHGGPRARDGRGRSVFTKGDVDAALRAAAAITRRADLPAGRRGTTTRWRRPGRSRGGTASRAHPVGRRAGRARPSSRS